LAESLAGKQVGGYVVGDLLGSGKSAVVCRVADRDDLAIKIYDPDLIERYGATLQLRRIERQLELVQEDHPNLVRTMGGGQCSASGQYFLVMENTGPTDLAACIETLPREQIRPLVRGLVSAAARLHELGLVHRDIKPSNIAIRPDGTPVLLDFGVIRPVTASDLTDGTDNRPFLGTLRYSSPEYLLRTEDNESPDCWIALTYYQIGAVLHDVIMRTPLFFDKSEPYARLVNAVIYDIPVVDAGDVSPALLNVTRQALLKNPDQRVANLTWQSFLDAVEPVPDQLESLRQRILVVQSGPPTMTVSQASSQRVAMDTALHKATEEVVSVARTTCLRETLLPRSTVELDRPQGQIQSVRLKFEPSAKHGLKHELAIVFGVHLEDIPSTLGFLSSASVIGLTDEVLAPVEDHKIYQGILERDLMKESIRTHIYRVFLAAIEIESPVQGAASVVMTA